MKYLSLESFSYQKQMFNYGEIEICNSGEPFDRNHIKTGNFKMSARESRALFEFLPMILGADIPPED